MVPFFSVLIEFTDSSFALRDWTFSFFQSAWNENTQSGRRMIA